MNPNDPSPAEIAQRCAEIRAGWTPAEKLKRLRADLRPTYRLADGRQGDIAADVYDDHITNWESITCPK